MKSFFDAVIGGIGEFALGLILLIVWLFYTGIFISLQTKIFPKFHKMKNSKFFDWIPLAVSYFIIIKALADFRSVEFDVIQIVVDCIFTSAFVWGICHHQS